jgi:lipoate-protein ligase A
MCAVDNGVPCRLIIDSPASGAWHMAVDEVLLESAAASGQGSLRFYRWSQPTLSLGYFQNYALRKAHGASVGCAVVRRQTGGGAILHDRELTYSIALPISHPAATDWMRLYAAAHEGLIAALGRLGVRAELCQQAAPSTARAQPFLCFERRAKGDVLIESSKVCGSAQRHRRGAILQHGSLLLAVSPMAPQLPGISELTGKSLDAVELAEIAAGELAERLRLTTSAQGLSAAELETAGRLAMEKYGGAAWNTRR